jgi:hypothetical protein
VRHLAFVDMSNVLSEAKKQQVIALGRLGWPLQRIEHETGVRREPAGAYLKAVGIGVRPPGAWGRRPPAKPANENEVTTGSDAAKPTPTINPNPNTENLSNKEKAKPANANAATTGFGVESTGLEAENPKRIRSASACEPFREAIELGLSRGRDATAAQFLRQHFPGYPAAKDEKNTGAASAVGQSWSTTLGAHRCGRQQRLDPVPTGIRKQRSAHGNES